MVVCSWSLLIRWAQRARCQAETPLSVLSRFPGPALLELSTTGLYYSALRQDSKLAAAVETSTRQAEAAEKANNISQENIQQRLRSYIIDEDIHFDHILDTHLETSIALRNVGQTPAYNVAFFARAAFLKIDKNGLFILPYEFPQFCDGLSPFGQVAIGAGVATSFRIAKTDISGNELDQFNPSELDDLRKARADFLLWGITCYMDIFEKAHFKKFCRFYSNEKDLKGNWGNPCGDNNEFDLPASATDAG